VPDPVPEVPLVPEVPPPEGTGGINVGDIKVDFDSSKNIIEFVSNVVGEIVAVG